MDTLRNFAILEFTEAIYQSTESQLDQVLPISPFVGPFQYHILFIIAFNPELQSCWFFLTRENIEIIIHFLNVILIPVFLFVHLLRVKNATEWNHYIQSPKFAFHLLHLQFLFNFIGIPVMQNVIFCEELRYVDTESLELINFSFERFIFFYEDLKRLYAGNGQFQGYLRRIIVNFLFEKDIQHFEKIFCVGVKKVVVLIIHGEHFLNVSRVVFFVFFYFEMTRCVDEPGSCMGSIFYQPQHQMTIESK